MTLMADSASLTGKHRWLSLGISAAAALFGVLLAQPVWRFGDGGEYYALYLAILKHGRPYMTSAGWDAYSALLAQGTIGSMVPVEALRSAFPTLIVNGTADLNHFWLYSGLAASIASIWRLVGVDLAPHSSFLMLHAILFGVTTGLAARIHGARGALVVALLLLASPILWFSAKVHTEFFTAALVLQAFILVSRGRFLYAALPIAIASTQNISLALTAWTLLAMGVLESHIYRRLPRPSELIAALVALLATALHPMYYLYRQGVITPQLKAGGISIGDNANPLLAVLLDPDIGLFPNWWLGILLIVVCTLLAIRLRPRQNVAYVIAGTIYLITNLFAQASTTNLNSGSIDLSRYALWYVPLFYGPAVWALDEISRRSVRLTIAVTLLAAPLLAWNLSWYWPSRYERYTEPSAFSRFIQSKLPALYDPPAEIFIERNSGHGEGSTPIGAIAGPGCRKLYIPASLIGMKSIPVISQNGCTFDSSKLASLVSTMSAEDKVGHSPGFYIALNDARFESLQREFDGGRTSFSVDADGISSLQAGWSHPESWGTWSNASHSQIRIRIRDCGQGALQVTLSARGFAIPQNPRVQSTMVVNGQIVGNVSFTAEDAGPKQYTFHYSCLDARRAGNIVGIEFNTVGAAVPAALGLSSDNRLLGIGVEWLDIRLL
jgi:hypothetical protein